MKLVVSLFMKYYGNRSYLTVIFSGFMVVGMLDRIFRHQMSGQEISALVVSVIMVLYFAYYGMQRDMVELTNETLITRYKMYGFIIEKRWAIVDIKEMEYDGRVLNVILSSGHKYNLRIDTNIEKDIMGSFQIGKG